MRLSLPLLMCVLAAPAAACPWHGSGEHPAWMGNYGGFGGPGLTIGAGGGMDQSSLIDPTAPSGTPTWTVDTARAAFLAQRPKLRKAVEAAASQPTTASKPKS